MKNDDKRWAPVRRGPVYCSPGCGYGCTHKAFLKAEAKAKRTAKALGDGWVPRLWDNLGWHWTVERSGQDRSRYPFAQVRGSGARDFEAEIAAGVMRGPHAGATGYVMQFWGSGTTPRKALEAAIDSAYRTRKMLALATRYAGGSDAL